MRLDSGLGLISVLMAMSGAAIGGVHDDIVMAAREDRTEEVVRYLRQGMDPDTADAAGTTLLMTAAANGNVRLVESLLRLRANVLKNNKYGESALALAALNGHQEVAKVLVQAGARINASGWGALHYAVFSGHADVVRYLIDQGADVNARAPNYHTALMLAARNGHGEIVRVLLAAGANPDLGDLEGNTALGIAQNAGNQEIAGLLAPNTLAGR
jgi:ankyrin repeat protein